MDLGLNFLEGVTMDNKDKNKDKGPRYPFDKMPYQEKEESLQQEYDDLKPDEELDIGESESRQKKRTLRDERGAGHEP